ncbi:SagB-type dehydrogenase family enzyme [Prauserella shujinwangii]|uniref:SagB-type dehydrogenase family enzyme n=1 Tax=Prauserella shujinwangii TaxID=1453103 RepID=A0A2T0LWD0_9PSEU|nr:SagB family peptide dehydrogenase [Prauserella shujinwangii]PRX48330.1 SagB-type dehydrogenase family enzyme [Prauserella shujinwangii]
MLAREPGSGRDEAIRGLSVGVGETTRNGDRVARRTERALAVHRLLNSQSPNRPVPLSDKGRIALPDIQPPRADLVAALAMRRSGYAYEDRDLEFRALSAWLRFAVGVQRFVPAYGRPEHPLGMAPTAGGLPSLGVYVLVRRAEEVPSGLYRYEAVSHELVELSTVDPTGALELVYAQPEFATRPAVSLALTARLDVAFGQYPLRHYRTLHVDSGVAVQNLYLVGTALGLSCCAVAEFDDAGLAALLGTPDTEIPTMLFAAGHAEQR